MSHHVVDVLRGGLLVCLAPLHVLSVPRLHLVTKLVRITVTCLRTKVAFSLISSKSEYGSTQLSTVPYVITVVTTVNRL